MSRREHKTYEIKDEGFTMMSSALQQRSHPLNTTRVVAILHQSIQTSETGSFLDLRTSRKQM